MTPRVRTSQRSRPSPGTPDLAACAPPRGALFGFKTEFTNDLVSLSCKKTGNAFPGRKFSQTFKRVQCFVKAKACGSPLGLAG